MKTKQAKRTRRAGKLETMTAHSAPVRWVRIGTIRDPKPVASARAVPVAWTTYRAK